MLGVLQTTWVGMAQFAKAHFGDASPADPKAATQVMEAVATFRALVRELRAGNGR